MTQRGIFRDKGPKWCPDSLRCHLLGFEKSSPGKFIEILFTPPSILQLSDAQL